MQASEAMVELGALAAGQWGLVTASQAGQAGVSRAQLHRLSSTGVLDRLAHGVYALAGSEMEEHAALRAAWLALDPARHAGERLSDGARGAVVSHASAAVLHGFGDLNADYFEFVVPARRQTRRPGLRLHRLDLTDRDVMLCDGLPVTTPVRTVVDLLRDGRDGGHVAGVVGSAVHARQLDLEDLASRLGPFAARFGLPRDDGRTLLRHLLELDGSLDRVFSDQLAVAARVTNVSLEDVLRAARDGRVEPIRELVVAMEQFRFAVPVGSSMAAAS